MAAYGNFALTLMQDYFAGKTLKALLVSSAYVQDVDVHDFLDDITGEITGGTYPAGGVALTGVAVTYDAATDTVKLDADDVVFSGLDAVDVAGIVFYVDTGVAGTSRLLGFDQYSSPIDASGGIDLTHEVDVAGVFTLSVTA